MPDVLIFSRERPCQLDLLLRSIRRHAYYTDVQILYRADTPDAIRGYMGILHDHGEWIRLTPERVFEDDVRFWLARADEVCGFLVDDDVFYRDAPLYHALPFSFRGGDYDYPLSVDGNLYHRDDLLHVLDEMPRGWQNPTQLEAIMHEHRHLVPFTDVTPALPPCLTGIPANVVSESSGMPSMGIDVHALNRAYLSGKRIDLDALERELESRPAAAHTAVEYELV